MLVNNQIACENRGTLPIRPIPSLAPAPEVQSQLCHDRNRMIVRSMFAAPPRPWWTPTAPHRCDPMCARSCLDGMRDRALPIPPSHEKEEEEEGEEGEPAPNC